MSEGLRIVAENSDAELEQNKFEQMPGYYRCNRCGHKWVALLAEMFEDPECRNPKCRK